MTGPIPYARPALADATTTIPIGVHVATDGAIVFDPPDEQLHEDLAVMMAAFCELYPKPNETTAYSRFASSTPDLTKQRDYLSDVLAEVLRQMGSPDGAGHYELHNMLASAFDRFPQFADFLELAAGCGDPAVDVLHPDNPLAAKTHFDFVGSIGE